MNSIYVRRRRRVYLKDGGAALPVSHLATLQKNIESLGFICSPALLDRYMSAAKKVTRQALGRPLPGPAIQTYTVPRLLVQNARLSEEARRLKDDPAAIEEIARRDLGLIRKGEKVFIVKDLAQPAKP